MAWLQDPGLPEKQVRRCLVSPQFSQILSRLEGEGIQVVPTEGIQALPAPLRFHGDLQLLPLGGNQFLAAQEAQTLAVKLKEIGGQVQRNSVLLGERYPLDISLNFLILGKRIYGHQKARSAALEHIIRQNHWQFIHSPQGYARCSVCLVGSHSAITSDLHLWRLLTDAGLDVLRLPPGDILLPGYDTGLLGGCCGLIHPGKLAFTGSLKQYRYGSEVAQFLKKHQVEAVCLTDGKMLDIGGIIPLETVD